ncbi:uncharacterized protein A4U43_C10F18020 [Asparagus officinalis]|uniref:J domain-containing protein n=1 Tax=Asparagus officinalis TaxID=4686 RepID=A0A5P1E3Y3_ASPOF|nr:uncharacterized protein A4U43_C10F18020 [Asparagus officinalis]
MRGSKRPLSLISGWFRRQPAKVKAFLGVAVGIATLVFIRSVVGGYNNLFVATEASHVVPCTLLALGVHPSTSHNLVNRISVGAASVTHDEEHKAFRAKAMEYHPDQNQGNKEAAEAKFKEVMVSYEAIKLERKNGRP